MKSLIVAAALAFAVAPMSTALAAVPIHAYEFNADASDSVGSADGTLQGGASISGGRLLVGAV